MNGNLTWPPTTATEGRASQRDIPWPPWSPRTVQALWILFISPIKLSIVAIFLTKMEGFGSDKTMPNQKWALQTSDLKTGNGRLMQRERERERINGKTVDKSDVLHGWVFIYVLIFKLKMIIFFKWQILVFFFINNKKKSENEFYLSKKKEFCYLRIVELRQSCRISHHFIFKKKHLDK